MAQANSAYYVLGYTSTNPAHDGKLRHISVKVARPGVTVLARKAYFAPLDATVMTSPAPPPAGKNEMSPEMRDLIAGALPDGRLGLRVAGGPLRSQGEKTLVDLVVEIDTSTLPLVERNGLLSNDLEMAFFAVDSLGKIQAASRSAGNLRLPPNQRGALANGLRYVVEFAVPPSQYNVHVAVRESNTGSGGLAVLDVDAPAFPKVPLAVGTLLLSSPDAQAVPTTGSYPLLKAMWSAPPTTARAFARAGMLAVLCIVSGTDVRSDRTLELVTSVKTSAGSEVYHSGSTKSGADLAAAKGSLTQTSEIPLATLEPGQYVLTVTARSSSGKTAAQSIGFQVQ